ncbi:MAG: glycosyltransferase [Bacteroidales bacterium]|nr:glycosyltransferase [Bacteroidales bacterium]
MAKDNKELFRQTLLFECAWEVCNKVGGIYTVIRSKVPAIVNKWNKDNYVLLGPYFDEKAASDFEPIEDLTDSIGFAVHKMRENGFDVRYGRWLITGKPRVVLFNPFSVFNRLGDIKYKLWADHYIQVHDEQLMDEVLAFGYSATEFFRTLINNTDLQNTSIIAHFHEWMAGMPIMDIRRENLPIKTVFTTHATMLGRYLAMNDHNFYNNLPFYNWENEAKHFNIFPTVQLERAAAHGSHVFTTVSDITAQECIHLLGREPDFILPNGLNIERFEALHEFQNMHFQYKAKINEFVRGHFFQSYSFDLDKTMYFVSSGRFEYQNKGFDLTLEALARLNYKMKRENIDATVIFFLITPQPYHSINAEVLRSRNLMEEIQRNTQEIERDLGKKLYEYITSNHGTFNIPDLKSMMSETLEMNLRRNVKAWQHNNLPYVVTHNLVNDGADPVLNFLRMSNLVNGAEDKVKVVYHPEFINSASPLFHMDYTQFIRGCHLGVFPSYYEPWGYTPLECMASGIPSITSDLAGFGSYIKAKSDEFENPEKMGIYVVNRNNVNYNDSAEQLANIMLRFVKLNRRERISLRNSVEENSVHFDWRNLTKHYFDAYEAVLER